jgi:glucose-1-phosphate thymidylyltransferase
MKALIAAGGSGTRLRPLTFSSNKHLLPIANKPLLLYPFESLVALGITEIGVIVNETRNAIESLLGDGGGWGVKVTYITQEKPLGLAHVVKISESFLAGEPFVFHLGDNIFTQGIERPYRHFMETQPDALLTLIVHEENYRLGVPYFDESGKLVKVVEKPQHPPNQFGIPGLYFFNSHVFEAFTGPDAIQPSSRGEYEITELYSYMIDHNYRVETEEVDGRWMDPGKFDDMLEANAYVLDLAQNNTIEGEVDQHSQILNAVTIGKGARVVNSPGYGPGMYR